MKIIKTIQSANIYNPYKNIYVAEVKNKYDLSMLFCRCQEYMESDNEDFRGKNFEMDEFQRWYAHKHGGVFTYPNDWDAFNLNSDVINECLNGVDNYTFNIFDIWMREIESFIFNEANNFGKFYLIGVRNVKDVANLDHEISHAFYHLDNNYFYLQTYATVIFTDKQFKKMNTNLKKLGYHEDVWNDEIIAYLSSDDYSDIYDGKLDNSELVKNLSKYKKLK